MRSLKIALLALTALACMGAALASPDRHSGADEQLRQVMAHVRQGRLGAALAEAERLTARHPNFRLAHLVRGDLLAVRAKPIGALGNGEGKVRERLEELRDEASARLRAYSEHPPLDRIPRYLMQLDPAQRHAIVVDASRWRVFLYENHRGVPRLVADYYTSLGKRGIDKLREGDQKTPLGVYHVTAMIPGSKLPDLYGWGAFPISYPNEWDRMQGRTGYGIWLHGVPSDTYARAPWASDGCIALANPDIEEIGKQLQVGITPVVISERVEWLTTTAWHAEREAFLRTLEAWRAAWESRDTEKYLAYYAPGFRSDTMNRESWSTHKRRVNAAKTWIKVSLSSVSVLRSPGPQRMMVVAFDQDYRSSAMSQRSRKRQYWVEDDGGWRIAYEAPARSVPAAIPESFPGRAQLPASNARMSPASRPRSS